MIIPPKNTLAELLKNSYNLFPEKTALSFVGQKPYTFKDVYKTARELSQLLHSRGIKKG